MKKILIVDDDEIFVKILVDSMPKEKYIITSVLNGEEGLKSIDTSMPDMIILDLVMPKMGGLEFLEALKNKNLNHKIPILISSQLSKIKDVSDAVSSGMEIGVKGYIIKSSQNMEMIIKTIESTLKGS